jgi:23S rRNA pseudouridine1911/1915/1917 synthase
MLDIAIPESCSGLRLDQALARLFNEFSRNRLTNWIKLERVRLNGAPASPSQKVWTGDRVLIEPQFDSLCDEPAAITLDIVYEDRYIAVINKPAGLVIHPGAGNPRNTLLNALLHHCSTFATLPRAGIVHRLDKDTSGLLVVAKTMAARDDLIGQLKARAVSRDYLALVHGRLSPRGTVEAPIGRHPRRRTQMSVVSSGKPAITHYETLQRFSDCTLAKVSLETGRTHQIRVHMHAIGHPVVGDPVYRRIHPASKAITYFSRQALHAFALTFVHPESRETVSFICEPPDDIRLLLHLLKEKDGEV